MDVILSTRNVNKALQVKTLFVDSTIRVLTLDEMGIEGTVEEDGVTLEENSTKKALFAHEHSNGLWVMADDSGLFIDAFNGEPGVNSAYWAGQDVSTETTMEYCIDRMKDVADRSATFRVVVVAISPEGDKHIFTDEVEGAVLKAPRVQPQLMMPYSSLFVPEGEVLSWAEMSTEHENLISHRGKAFRKVRKFLESLSSHE